MPKVEVEFDSITNVLKVEQFGYLLNDKCAKIDDNSSGQSFSNGKADKQLAKLDLPVSVKILPETRRRSSMFFEEKNYAAAAAR